MFCSSYFRVFCLYPILLIINSQFYTKTDLSNFPNTQVASAAVCPKCLKMTSDGFIGFYNCDSNVEQTFRLELESNDLGIFGVIKSRVYKNQIFPTFNNVNNFDVTYNLFEIFPVDDDGGHSIQIIGSNLCLYHDHVLSNTNTQNYTSLFRACDYSSRYFKFYFFRTLYTFPEYKVVGKVYVYTLKESRVQSNLMVLKKASVIKFTESTTGQVKQVLFDSTSLTFDVQLPEGDWIVQVEVINNTYYYKPDPYYYFPIKRCHEDKDYWLEVPVRKFYNNGTNRSRGGYRIVFRITAIRNIYIRKVYNAVTWMRTCGVSMGYGRGNGIVENIKLEAGKCIFVVGYIPISDTTDRGGWGSFHEIMNTPSYRYDSLIVYNGCEVSGGNYVITHTDHYVFFSRKWWDCVRGVNPAIELWDDQVIKDSWENKY